MTRDSDRELTISRRSASIDLRAAALDHLARGWHVFPLIPGGKTPAIPAHAAGDPNRASCRGQCGRLGHGVHDATVDRRTVTHWWTYCPTANLGISCGPSGLLVLDLDTPKQPDDRPPAEWTLPGVHDGADVLTVLADRAGQPVPVATHIVRTGSGGLHLYFQQPPGPLLGNSSQRLGWKIDTRGAGGYVVAAGSVVDGRKYATVDGTAAAPLPRWLADTLTTSQDGPARLVSAEDLLATVRRRSAYTAAALTAELDRVLAAPDGRRNHTLNSAAYNLGRLTGTGLLPEQLAAEALIRAGLAVGLGVRESRGTVRSGLSAGSRHPRSGPG